MSRSVAYHTRRPGESSGATGRNAGVPPRARTTLSVSDDRADRWLGRTYSQEEHTSNCETGITRIVGLSFVSPVEDRRRIRPRGIGAVTQRRGETEGSREATDQSPGQHRRPIRKTGRPRKRRGRGLGRSAVATFGSVAAPRTEQLPTRRPRGRDVERSPRITSRSHRYRGATVVRSRLRRRDRERSRRSRRRVSGVSRFSPVGTGCPRPCSEFVFEREL